MTKFLENRSRIQRNAIGQWAVAVKDRSYLLCVDPNFGAIGADYWVVQVWDITDLPIQLVHEYRDNQHSTIYHRQQTLNLIGNTNWTAQVKK